LPKRSNGNKKTPNKGSKNKTKSEEICLKRKVEIKSEEADFKKQKIKDETHAIDDENDRKKLIPERNEVSAHLNELDELSKKDPEFYHFLENEEPTLLNFTEAENELELGDDEKPLEEDENNTTTVLTKKLLRSYQKKAFIQKSSIGLKLIMRAFCSACFIGDPNNKSFKGKMYSIPSEAIFFDLMISFLDNGHKAILLQLFPSQVKSTLKKAEREVMEGLKKTGENLMEKELKDLIQRSKAKAVENLEISNEMRSSLLKSSKFKSFQIPLKRLFASFLHLIKTTKDPTLLEKVLRYFGYYTKFMPLISKIQKDFLKEFLEIWTNYSIPKSESIQQNSKSILTIIQLLAYLRIREIYFSMGYPVIKSMYTSFVKICRTLDENFLPGFSFRLNCFVDLMGLDMSKSYEAGFIFIKQLAILLRKAVVKMTPEVIGDVLKWQYILCLKIWAEVLSVYSKEDELMMLIHPLVTVTDGVIKLAPPLEMFALRSHCIQILHKLSASANMHIPTIPYLFKHMSFDVFYKAHKRSTEPQPNIHFLLKIPKEKMPIKVIKDAVMNETFRLIQESIELNRYSAAFPEIMIPITFSLRKYLKTKPEKSWTIMTKSLINLIQAYAAEACERRKKIQNVLEFSKNDVKVENLIKENEKSSYERFKSAQEALNIMISKSIVTAIPTSDKKRKEMRNGLESGKNNKKVKTEEVEENISKEAHKTIPDLVKGFEPADWSD